MKDELNELHILLEKQQEKIAQLYKIIDYENAYHYTLGYNKALDAAIDELKKECKKANCFKVIPIVIALDALELLKVKYE